MSENPTSNPKGLDPNTIHFTPGVLRHAEYVGFTLEQMRAALADPRWVNPVRRQPDPTNQTGPRYRYCGHGVAVIVEDHNAIAVIADDPRKKPLNPAQRPVAVAA
ncbi:MAG: hypothetical protein DI630_36925 [Gordonia sp. (in: high G+C Gram-positive bacteria)]|nr:MAG: hypothetical protein DI630_36925 [Gordonia sp. (in: high G+C Gram-positive bacteria)]